MALVKCKICKNDVIETAPKCPHCNSLGPKKSRRITWIMIGIVVVLGIAVTWVIYNRTQEKGRTRAEVQTDRRNEKIHQRVMSASFLLKTSVADPATLDIDTIKTNTDGSVLCYHYNLKDKSGKAQKKKAVFAEGDLHYSAGSWGIYCDSKNLMELPEKKPSEF